MTPPITGSKPGPPDERIRCPKDATIMEKLAVGSFQVDHCGRCGSMWFDAYELEAVLRAKGAPAEVDFGTAKHSYANKVYRSETLECPRDHSVMMQIPDPRQPHVIIDMCRSCGGVFLDSGELKDLSEFTLGERVRAFFQKP